MNAELGKRSSNDRGIKHTRIADDSVLDQRYDIGEKLGQGNFGVVYQATKRTTQEPVAVKIVSKDKAGSSGLKLLEREISILKNVSHDHIIAILEIFETQSKVFLIMEICDRGELSEILKKMGKMDERSVQIVAKRLARAISYMHMNGIVHRDLKMENILVRTNPSDPNDQLYVKVTDFGLSVVRGGTGTENMLQLFCGTPAYMAPEIVQNKSYTESCDNWSLGCIIYALLVGRLPFLSSDEDHLYDAIKNIDPDWSACVKAGASELALTSLRKLLEKDPAKRLRASELLLHQWITGENRQTKNVLDLMHDFHIANPDGANSGDTDSDNEQHMQNVNEGAADSASSSIPPPAPRKLTLVNSSSSLTTAVNRRSSFSPANTTSSSSTASPAGHDADGRPSIISRSPSEREVQQRAPPNSRLNQGSKSQAMFQASLPATVATKMFTSGGGTAAAPHVLSRNKSAAGAPGTPSKGVARSTSNAHPPPSRPLK